MSIQFCLSLIGLILVGVLVECKLVVRKSTNNVIIKKLLPIEIAENVPIGYTITDLKANLIDHHKNSDEVYFNFEFNPDFNDNLNHHHQHHHRHHHHHNHETLMNSFNLYNYFLLDSYTGVLKTSKQLDLENFCDLNICSSTTTRTTKTCTISFKIKATKYYHTRNEHTGSLYKDSTFHISFDLIILDVNEFEPVFDEHKHKHDLIVFNITEEFAPIKLPIGSVAYDNDCTDRNNLVYSLRISKVNNQLVDRLLKQANSKLNDLISVMFNFTIQTDQMLLFLFSPKSIDRELVQSIELKLIATDRVNASDAKQAALNIFINVVDINDHSPKFENQIVNLELDEGLPSDTEIIRLKASDLDDDLNGKVTYEFAILTDEIKETFALNSSTGSITLRKRLNYEHKSFWQLSIRASDQSLTTRKSSIALVNLHVNDINNHKPEINLNLFLINSYIGTRAITCKNVNTNTHFKEDIIYLSPKLPKNSAIGMVTFSDRDSRLNGQIEFCDIQFLNEKNLARLELVDINDETFRFSSNENLDQEMKSLYYGDLKFLPASLNEKRYLIRTNSNLNEKKGTHKFEIKASDNGVNYKLTSKKQATLIIGDSMSEHFKYDETTAELNQIINMLNQDYDLEDVGSAKNIYSLSLDENNKHPIELTKLAASDFDITFEVTYSIMLMPSTRPASEFQLKIIQCSLDLYKYIFIGPLTGVLVLNASLDREMCSDYLFIVKASHLVEKRLNSFIYLHLNVRDLNDNRPAFEFAHYQFNVHESASVNKSIGYPIRILDADTPTLNTNLTVEIIANDEASLLNSYFQIRKQEEENSNEMRIYLKKQLDFETRKKYEFKLIVTDGVPIESGNKKANVNRATQIEINVLDSNEHKPSVKQLVSAHKNTTASLVNITRISHLDDDYLVVVHLDNIFSGKFSPLFDLVNIEAQDLDVDERYSKLNYSIQNVKYLAYDLVNARLDVQFSKKCNQTSLFSLKQTRLVVDLNKFYHRPDLQVELKECSIPLVALLEIKISDNGEPALFTNLNLKLIFINNKLTTDKLTSIENYLIEKYSNHPNYYLTSKNFEFNLTKLNNKNTFEHSKEKLKGKNFQEFFSTIHPPLIIVSILILVLLLTVISLFIMSIIYSVSVCKYFKCKVNNVLKGGHEPNNLDSNFDCSVSEQTKMFANSTGIENKLVVKEDCTDYEGDGEKSDESDKSKFRQKLNTWLSSTKNNTETHSEPGTQHADKNNENVKYLLDSPILIRKFNDTESQSNYLKKYHLEYLMNQNFSNDNSNSTSMNESVTTKQEKPKSKKLIAKFKKITFKFENTTTPPVSNQTKSNGNKKCTSTTTSTEEDMDESQLYMSSNDDIKKLGFDDDLIIPFRTTQSSSNIHYVKRPQQPHDPNSKKKSSPTKNHVTYKKATFLPEDNIWVKKVIPNEIPKQNSINNQNFVSNEIVI